MMVLVNSLFISANSKQSQVNPSTKQTVQGDDFLSFLSKNMRTTEMTQNSNIRKFSSAASMNYQRSNNCENNVQQNDKTDTTNMEPDRKILENGQTTVESKVEKSEQLQRTTKKSSDEQVKELLSIIDEIMAVLQELNVFFKNTESFNANEDITNTDLTEKLETIFNDSISRLLELANCSDSKVSELAQNIADKMKQMLTTDVAKWISEEHITVNTGHIRDLISKMLYEAANAKTELISETTVNNANLQMETAKETEDSDENGVQTGNQAETTKPKQNSNSDLDYSVNLKEQNKNGRASVSDGVNIRGKPEFSDITQLNDYNQVLQKASESIQVNDADFSNAMKSSMPTKADILHQITDKAKILVGSDKSEMIIKLKPESLGKIQLQVIHERGEIVAKFMAESEQVKSIIESNMQLLKDALEENGIDIQSLSVSVGQQGHSDDNDNDNDKGQHTQNHLQNIFYEDSSDMTNENQSYRYTGLAGNLYGFRESEINLTA